VALEVGLEEAVSVEEAADLEEVAEEAAVDVRYYHDILNVFI
jgi:hypothetical protein